jgi:hypothetical protein
MQQQTPGRAQLVPAAAAAAAVETTDSLQNSSLHFEFVPSCCTGKK